LEYALQRCGGGAHHGRYGHRSGRHGICQWRWRRSGHIIFVQRMPLFFDSTIQLLFGIIIGSRSIFFVIAVNGKTSAAERFHEAFRFEQRRLQGVIFRRIRRGGGECGYWWWLRHVYKRARVQSLCVSVASIGLERLQRALRAVGHNGSFSRS
jgi:hypothetical protein